MHKHNFILLLSFLVHNPTSFILLSTRFFFSIKAFPKQTADPASIMERSVSPSLTYREACPAVTFQMNNTQREGEEMKGTRDRMEVEKRGKGIECSE